MSDKNIENELGLLLKKLLKERSISMRKLSELTEIDTATISRIVNGKRKAKPEHLQKFSECFGVPISDFFIAAGFQNEEKKELDQPDIFMSVENIQSLLESSNVMENKFSIGEVEQQLANFEKYVQTEEGKENILESFTDKLEKTGSIGPFINQLKDLYEKFRFKKGTPKELVMIGSALIYFIVSVDVIPDYIFPLGYIDDAMAIQIITNVLKIKS